jgi:hypothetical protein
MLSRTRALSREKQNIDLQAALRRFVSTLAIVCGDFSIGWGQPISLPADGQIDGKSGSVLRSQHGSCLRRKRKKFKKA